MHLRCTSVFWSQNALWLLWVHFVSPTPVTSNRRVAATAGTATSSTYEVKVWWRVRPSFWNGQRTALVTLTRPGRELLESHRQPGIAGRPQIFYAGLAKPREATHDAQLSRVVSVEPEIRPSSKGRRAGTLVGLDPANGVAAPDDARLYHLSVDTGTGQLPKIAQVDAVAFRDGPQDSWVMREIPLR